MFPPTYRESLRDGNLYVEEEDSGSEPRADPDGILGIAEDAAHAAGNQARHQHQATLNLTGGFGSAHFILMMSMPVTVRLTWSPAAAQSKGSSWRVMPATRQGECHHRRKMALSGSNTQESLRPGFFNHCGIRYSRVCRGKLLNFTELV